MSRAGVFVKGEVLLLDSGGIERWGLGTLLVAKGGYGISFHS